MDFAPVKGTRDFYPEELAQRNWLFGKFRETALKFGFEEFDTCILEHEELYIRKAGDEITGQLYNFEDKGGRRLALRPELTPSLARMIMAKEKNLQYPVKWFSIPQCFRYEKMQKGRRREHFQWNMDIIGQAEITAEAELLSAIVTLCTSLGLSAQDLKIRMSNRKILQEVFVSIGLPENRFAEVCVIIDKRDKIGDENVTRLLTEAGIESKVTDGILQLLQARKQEEIVQLNGSLPAGLAEMNRFFTIAELYGIRDYIEFDISVIRGLSYYTGIVFEVFDTRGQSRAICGGGRYDNLMQTLGGKSLPMVGFGFGDVVISDILTERGLFPPYKKTDCALVFPFSEAEQEQAIKLAASLRRKGEQVELDLTFRKLKKLLSQADKTGYRRLYILAPDELKDNKILVKNLADRTETRVAAGDLID